MTWQATEDRSRTCLLQLLLLAMLYVATGKLGLMLAHPGTNATPVWPPTGIALSAVLLMGNRVWPGIALGACILNWLYLMELGLTIPLSFAAACTTSAGNTLEALLGACLIRHFTGTGNPFSRSRDVLSFIAFGALLSTTLSATVGTAVFCFSISAWNNFAVIWLTWWLGDVSGALLLVPLFMTFAGAGEGPWSFRQRVESLGLVLCIAVICYLVFFLNYPLLFLLLPVIIVTGISLGQCGSAVIVCLIAGISIYATIGRTGPFAASSLNTSLLLLQSFIGSIAMATMVLAATVAEKKRSLAILSDSEEHFRAAFEQAAVGMAFVGLDGGWLRVNKKLCDIVGYGKNELLNLSFQDITHPDDLEADLSFVRQMLRGEITTYTMEKRYIHKDRHHVWIHLTVSLARHPSGAPKYFISVVEEISGRKQVERQLRLSEEKFRGFVEQSSDGIYLLELTEPVPRTMPVAEQVQRVLKGRICECNSTMAAMCGYDSATAMKDATLETVYGRLVRPEMATLLASWVERGYTVEDVECRTVDSRGSTAWFSCNIRGVIESGCLTGAWGSHNPITDRKHSEMELEKYRNHLVEEVEERTIELRDSQKALMNIVEDLNLKTEELEIANNRLKELDRLKSMFIASMSHELRTPLNSIIGFTGILLQGLAGEINAEQRDQLQRVSRAGRHLLALITDVIDVSKIEAGKVDLYLQEFALGELLEEAVAAVVAEATAKGMELSIQIGVDIKNITSDRRRLLQCIINLLSNGIKYSEKGRVTLAAEKENGFLLIRVTDTGIGISEENMAHLFASFVRFDSPLKIKAGGTGLGLYLTRKIVTELLGGEVFAESRLGAGSVFSIRIPAAPKQLPQPETY